MSKIKVLDKNIHLVQDYLRSCSVDEKMLEAKAGFEEDFCEAAEELKELCEIKSMIVKSLIPSKKGLDDSTNKTIYLRVLNIGIKYQGKVWRHQKLATYINCKVGVIPFDGAIQVFSRKGEFICEILKASD